ncbi:MAG: acyl-CoA synthetase [Proteobacteria bacterium]|nr:acyl-CoA synthetase [Pseudomonadota bacterium]MBT6464670.1 acyl-CoA synthetase [Pseudomonadota bacterium]MBT7624988.1 acyl-CoA synthetase [Pseudomonadota bacterium]
MTTSSGHIYERDLDKNAANYAALSPLSWVERAAAVYPKRTSVVHGDIQHTWEETFTRCRRLSSALSDYGIKTGDAVAVLATNIPAFYECLFGIPAAGAVINPINIRLDSDAIAFILDHGEARILITDTEFSHVVKEALTKCKNKPYVIDISDPEALSHEKIGEIEYEDFLATGDPEAPWTLPTDEWQAMALCYTSGTTGNPKGVVYHHRGAYLNAIGCATAWNMTHHPTYLWTLPMFHCCGWTFPWTIAALAGTNICLRKIAAKNIYDAIEKHEVTHFCGAPIVLNFIVNADPKDTKPLPHLVEVMTAGAAPPAAVLKATEKAGFHITHTYGLTETYGPAVFNAPQDDWATLNEDEYAETLIRQGVRYPVLQDLDVMDPETMMPVPRDGETIGEIMFKGNVVMRGYLKNPRATEESLRGGYFHSGDLAVMHPDGYLQIKDRSKDIIISGGENISSIEVEELLYKHPSILEAAVVARPDDKWGETPCAFVTLKPTSVKTTEQDIINYCKEKIAKFKSPKTVIFIDLPKTSTGKIQKFKLRAQAEAMGSL